MCPVGIYLYEIDSSFGPNLIAEYNITDAKVNKEVLKKLTDKHVKKDLVDATTQLDKSRFFSSKLESEPLKQKNIYLGFILREDEDLISLKSVFENIQGRVAKSFDEKNREKMRSLLKDTLNSILSLMEKLKEPGIIHETINEKTKVLLDDGKLQEARELIDLGEEIPKEFSELIKEADKLFSEKNFKKAKKKFLKASQLAAEIQEGELVEFLRNKAKQVGNFPDLIDRRVDLINELSDILKEFERDELKVYDQLIDSIDDLLSIANTFGENEKFDLLTDFMNLVKKASNKAKDLYDLDKKINEFLLKL
ncbi:MAG: hypothetical protein P8Y70_02665 [Candidatus Lokiarchaeota archaeon]